jgi:hypothetical protein
MPDKEQIVCEGCHERDATHHVCDPGTGGAKNLCAVCYEELVSPEVLASHRDITDAIRNGKCKYCGEPAAGGCGSSIPFLGNQLELWCEQCRQDLVEFLSRPENAIPDFPFYDEVARQRVPQQLAEHQQRQKEFMDQRVLERRRKNDA